MANPPREACGVVGVYTPHQEAARSAFFGLFSLQHRGQESAGIATSDGLQMYRHSSMGMVSQAFHEFDLHRLPGGIAIGHTRYSTTGSSNLRNSQPFLVPGPYGELALGHNGNVINAMELRKELSGWGCRFYTTTDSEVIAHLLANAPGKDWGERVAYMMRRLQGAYSLVGMTLDSIFAIRDPLGVRPLCIGEFNGGWVVASESCALDHIGARYERELEPGEAIMINQEGVQTIYRGNQGRRALCVFENIYFSRPDSYIGNTLVYSTRFQMGRQLVKEHPVAADIVIGVPDSATAAAAGYSEESGIPYREGLVKNRFVGRTFIQPDQRIRELGVQLKFNPLPDVLVGKRVVLVDDSIVRGTTTPHVVGLLRKAGALEVHVRVCSPPIMWPCHFGVDMATRRELIANKLDIPGICRWIGADSLGYLSLEGLFRAAGSEERDFCGACFTGKYPIEVQIGMDKLELEQV